MAPEKLPEINFLLQTSEGNSVHILSGIAFGAAQISLSLQEDISVSNINWNC